VDIDRVAGAAPAFRWLRTAADLASRRRMGRTPHQPHQGAELDVLAFVRRIPATEPPADEEVRRWRSAIDVALADIVAREQIGRQLQKRYAECLAVR
jgi:hypothetical protein